jgi:K+-sensing histidine kinase KdpD
MPAMWEHSADANAEPPVAGRVRAPAAVAHRPLLAGDWFARPATRYALALLLVLVSLAIRVPLDPLIGAQAPFIFYFPAILVSSVLGGLGPGFVATLVSAGLVLLQLGAPGGLDQPDVITTIAYAIVGVAISWIGDLLLRARHQAASGTLEVLAREAHLQSILDTVPDAMIVIDETEPCIRSALQRNGCSAIVPVRRWAGT